MSLQHIELVIEKGDDGVWGRVNYNDNLIVDEAKTIDELEVNLKTLLHDVEGVDPENVLFDRRYDVYSLFEQFDFLNISKVAKHAGIHQGLLRQYASGVKHPSVNQAKKIEETIHKLAEQMKNASVYVV
jgi:hypothetical protein